MNNKLNDLFNGTDDNMVEEISKEFPALSDAEKERLFAMSEKKYNSDNIQETDLASHSDEVKGVEIYRRPVWKRCAAFAAALAVVGGGIFGGYKLRGKFSHNDHDKVMSEITSEEESTTAESTEAVSEESTEAAETPTEAQTDADVNTTAEHLYERFIELESIVRNDVTSTNDPDDVITWETLRFFRLDDSRFSDLDEMRAYFLSTVTEDYFESQYGKSFGTEFTGAEDDYPDGHFVMHDGAIYCDTEQIAGYFGEWTDEPISVYMPDGNSYELQRYYIGLDGQKHSLTLTAVAGEDGALRISEANDILVNEDGTENTDLRTAYLVTERFLDAYNLVFACTMNVDETDVITKTYSGIDGDEEYRYYRSIDDRYTSIEDLDNYINSAMTDNMYSFYGVDAALHGDRPRFIEENGNLYCLVDDMYGSGYYPSTGNGIGAVRMGDDMLSAGEWVETGNSVSGYADFILKMDESGEWRVDNFYIEASDNVAGSLLENYLTYNSKFIDYARNNKRAIRSDKDKAIEYHVSDAEDSYDVTYYPAVNSEYTDIDAIKADIYTFAEEGCISDMFPDLIGSDMTAYESGATVDKDLLGHYIMHSGVLYTDILTSQYQQMALTPTDIEISDSTAGSFKAKAVVIVSEETANTDSSMKDIEITCTRDPEGWKISSFEISEY